MLYLQIWVLTGDKLETALNIANSCGHFKRGTEILTVSGKELVSETLENMKYVLLIGIP